MRRVISLRGEGFSQAEQKIGEGGEGRASKKGQPFTAH